MNYYTSNQCDMLFPPSDSTTQLCAGIYGQSIGACYGDSGGHFTFFNLRQLMIKKLKQIYLLYIGPINSYIGSNWYVTGIASWVYICGEGAVYTRASYYLDWIKSVIFFTIFSRRSFKGGMRKQYILRKRGIIFF